MMHLTSKYYMSQFGSFWCLKKHLNLFCNHIRKAIKQVAIYSFLKKKMGILKKKKAPPYSKPKTISYKEILFKNSACTNHRFNSIFCCRNLVITLEQMTEIFISLDNFTPQRLAEVETMLSFIPALPKNESSKN